MVAGRDIISAFFINIFLVTPPLPLGAAQGADRPYFNTIYDSPQPLMVANSILNGIFSQCFWSLDGRLNRTFALYDGQIRRKHQIVPHVTFGGQCVGHIGRIQLPNM